jgi:hypothetical protein
MRVQVVQKDRYFFRFLEIMHDQPFRFLRPVPFRPMCPNRDATPIQKRSDVHKYAGRSVAFVFVINPFGMACMTISTRPCREDRPRFLEQLDRLLIHRNDRIFRVRRAMINFKHFLHASDEFLVGLGRRNPILDFLRS